MSDTRNTNRCVCYCADCQAFAHFLGRAAETLDERGGSDIVQALPKNVTFTQGLDKVACIRLTGNGLLRWYTTCCRTPIGNTLATPKMSFIGLVHTCLAKPLDDSFGPIRASVNTQSAKGDPKPRGYGVGATIGWFLRTVLRARFNGDYQRTPFFDAAGKPVATPHILTADEHAKVFADVGGTPS